MSLSTHIRLLFVWFLFHSWPLLHVFLLYGLVGGTSKSDSSFVVVLFTIPCSSIYPTPSPQVSQNTHN
ncbi:hypothetical protein VNO77_36768 [Canavalia gladiata]|uniref:Uncharacterized protein n=1 Tax=Canavalia gladiata TaxID=3824 RepID=A0AAN9K9L2_CANGL